MHFDVVRLLLHMRNVAAMKNSVAQLRLRLGVSENHYTAIIVSDKPVVFIDVLFPLTSVHLPRTNFA